MSGCASYLFVSTFRDIKREIHLTRTQRELLLSAIHAQKKLGERIFESDSRWIFHRSTVLRRSLSRPFISLTTLCHEADPIFTGTVTRYNDRFVKEKNYVASKCLGFFFFAGMMEVRSGNIRAKRAQKYQPSSFLFSLFLSLFSFFTDFENGIRGSKTVPRETFKRSDVSAWIFTRIKFDLSRYTFTLVVAYRVRDLASRDLCSQQVGGERRINRWQKLRTTAARFRSIASFTSLCIFLQRVTINRNDATSQCVGLLDEFPGALYFLARCCSAYSLLPFARKKPSLSLQLWRIDALRVHNWQFYGDFLSSGFFVLAVLSLLPYGIAFPLIGKPSHRRNLKGNDSTLLISRATTFAPFVAPCVFTGSISMLVNATVSRHIYNVDRQQSILYFANEYRRFFVPKAGKHAEARVCFPTGWPEIIQQELQACLIQLRSPSYLRDTPAKRPTLCFKLFHRRTTPFGWTYKRNSKKKGERANDLLRPAIAQLSRHKEETSK